MATSGLYSFDPSLADTVLDAFGRLQIRPAALTPDHMFSARRSLNQLFVRFSNRGINLWAVDEVTVLLNANQGLYNVEARTMAMLETWIRTYQMNALESVTVDFSTTIGDATVVVGMADNGLQVGWYVTLPIYVSVGGIIIQGTYLVTEASTNTFTIEAADDATSTVNNGGAVPEYAATLSSTTITTTLADHGLVDGETFTVHVATIVGGVTLQGDYIVTVTGVNTFTFTAPNAATATDSAFENDGECQIATQNGDVVPQDRIMMPISRTDWASITNKTQTGGYPTTYWFDRTDPPTVNLWLVPNGSLVQELHYFRMTQLQDANPQGEETPDIPYRFDEALVAGLAMFLAMAWKPEFFADAEAYFEKVWAEAMAEDRERVTLNLSPNIVAYYT